MTKCVASPRKYFKMFVCQRQCLSAGPANFIVHPMGFPSLEICEPAGQVISLLLGTTMKWKNENRTLMLNYI